MAEDFERGKGGGGGIAVVEEVGEDKLVDAGWGVFEFGVHFEAVEVADDEEGRVAEGLVVLVELLVGAFEVAAFGLVLPGEPAAFPNVDEATIVGAGFGHVFFEAVGIAEGVLFRGVGDAEHFAEVTKMLWGGGALCELAGFPLADKCY